MIMCGLHELLVSQCERMLCCHRHGWQPPRPLFSAHVAPDGMVSFDDAPDFIVDGFGIGPFMIGNDPRRGRSAEPPSFSMSYSLRELIDYLPILKLFGHFNLEAALARARRRET